MSTALVTSSEQLSTFLGMDRETMLDTLKAQCFRGAKADQISDFQLAAFVSVANEMKVNPLLPGMLYAYPTTGGGIVPMMGPDGVFKKLMEHPEVASWETEIYPEDPAIEPTHAVTRIYRKGGNIEHPIKYVAYFKEWKVGSNPNWTTRPRHMLGLRSLKQAARQIIHGLPHDEDDKTTGDLINVTPVSDNAGDNEAAKAARAAAPKKEKGAAAAVAAAKTAEKVTDAANAPIDVTVTPVTPKAETVVTPAPVIPKAEPAKPVATAAPAAPAASSASATTVRPLQQDVEDIYVGVLVNEFEVKDVMKTPNSVKASIAGLPNNIYHIGGGSDAAWQKGKPITIKILGKKLKATGEIVGLVQTIAITDDEESFG